MATADDVRRLAGALPQVEDGSTPERLAFSVAGKGFAWTWDERVAPKTPRTPNLGVLAVRCRPELKEVLLEAEPDVLFTEPHYSDFPAVLDRVTEHRLAELLKAAWFCQAPKKLLPRSLGTVDSPQ